ncbi:Rrf2 family transcriptional regulator [Clostridium cochlearium]|jgi:Rrf2 family protein|uniref:RRF2 family protein n=1 Tax=Clostridium cochlearium TaxID=1494 RepID=A0A2X2Y453_CLOCO|nr:Rrf2 family transcriptional regulator [Clostridium cochlearium]MCR1970586.1 Rrf2 family transcriptional regulator [Clostridium cochlearium]MDU1443978.1 Rrf2 family transcriptional regulator [Clostridium cochlearium]NMA57330.1 Rrf2 family transcriptional regulator [Clostridium cochlearium]NME95413.1 Rrf2 family transcriptional regulator [Clostridium cochlearium]SQB33280.1 RRF2 family protein [Clostridium cochlearium]
MEISTKGRYGLKAIVNIGVYSSLENVTKKSISEREDISEKYLEQILSALRKNGLVNSKKGPQGGYTLARNSSEITVGDILRALEGELQVVNLEEYDDSNIMELCLKKNVWNKLNKEINNLVDSITLEELVQEYKAYKNPGYMYYI